MKGLPLLMLLLLLAAAAMVGAAADDAPQPPALVEEGERHKTWFRLDALINEQEGGGAQQEGTAAAAEAARDAAQGDQEGDAKEAAVKDKTGGSTTVLANKNFMSIMEDAEGRELSPHLAAAEGRLEAHEAARKREQEGVQKRMGEANQKHKRHKQAVAAANQREREAAAAKGRAVEEVQKAQAKAAELNRRTAQLRAKVQEENQKKTEKRWRFAKGWQDYNSGYQRATATVKDGSCELEGLVRQTDTRARQIGYLPKHCRPSGRVMFSVKMGARKYNGNRDVYYRGVARIDILSSGLVYLVASTHSVTWLSFGGIRIRVGAADNSIALVRGWRPYGGTWRAPGVAVESVKGGRLCTVSGLIRGGQWGYYGRVPRSECYPDHRLVFSVSNHVRVQRLGLLTNGYLHREGGSQRHGWITLDGVIYPGKGSASVNLPLTTSWRHYDSNNWGPARYHRLGSVCLLSGLVVRTRGSRSSAATIARLPSGCRPANRLIFQANTHDYSARVDVLADGRVVYVGGAYASWLSLSNINFVARR